MASWLQAASTRPAPVPSIGCVDHGWRAGRDGARARRKYRNAVLALCAVKASTLPAHNSPIDTLMIAIAVTRKWVDESAGRQVKWHVRLPRATPFQGRARAAPRGQSPRGSAIDMNAHILPAPDQPAFLNCLLAQRISLLARQNSLITPENSLFHYAGNSAASL